MSVTPYFELHIKPMFRAIDRDHMLWKLDLWDYDKVVALAPRIAEMLRKPPPNSMPTKASGGPWPEGWIQVFEAWAAQGFQRLQRTDGQYSARRLGNGQVMLNVSVQLQNGGADAWLEREQSLSPTDVEYTLCLRPAPQGVNEAQRTNQLTEMLGSTVQQVFITDTTGRRNIVIQT
jgi:hypothetical protein